MNLTQKWVKKFKKKQQHFYKIFKKLFALINFSPGNIYIPPPHQLLFFKAAPETFLLFRAFTIRSYCAHRLFGAQTDIMCRLITIHTCKEFVINKTKC